MSDILIPDISRWQGNVDWTLFHPPAVILKAGGADGGYYEDVDFKTEVANADTHGVPWIAYYFADPAGDPGLQAAHFHAIAGDKAKVPDVEMGTGDQRAFASAFCANLSGPILYTGLNHELVDNLQGIAPTWIAAYGPNEPTVAHVLWQHSSTARYPGIVGNVDESIFHGSMAQLLALFGAQKTQGETEMKVIQGDQTTEVYITDGITKRYVENANEFGDLFGLCGQTDLIKVHQGTIDRIPTVGEAHAPDRSPAGGALPTYDGLRTDKTLADIAAKLGAIAAGAAIPGPKGDKGDKGDPGPGLSPGHVVSADITVK